MIELRVVPWLRPDQACLMGEGLRDVDSEAIRAEEQRLVAEGHPQQHAKLLALARYAPKVVLVCGIGHEFTKEKP